MIGILFGTVLALTATAIGFIIGITAHIMCREQLLKHGNSFRKILTGNEKQVVHVRHQRQVQQRIQAQQHWNNPYADNGYAYNAAQGFRGHN